jgi:hypothetical protein
VRVTLELGDRDAAGKGFEEIRELIVSTTYGNNLMSPSDRLSPRSDIPSLWLISQLWAFKSSMVDGAKGIMWIRVGNPGTN